MSRCCYNGAAEAQAKDYLIWDDELPGFGLRVFSSGKRSYVIQYRTKGRSSRYTIGLHGAWAPETARREAKVQLGWVAGGDDPVEDRQLDHKAITVKELCTRYLADLQASLILGKGGRPKKASTIVTDTGRIERHIIPLIGGQDQEAARKGHRPRGAGTAARTVGLGGILTYAVDAGIIESNPAHGIRKPKDNVRKRRLSEAEYRILGRMLRDAAEQEKYTTIVDIVRQIAVTGCRRSEMIGLKWTEADTEASCLRLEDSKEGESIRPIGLSVVEYLERRRIDDIGTYVFQGQG
jgi:integrase